METYSLTNSTMLNKVPEVFKAYSLIECHICEQINKAAEALGRTFTEGQLPRVQRDCSCLCRLGCGISQTAKPC